MVFCVLAEEQEVENNCEDYASAQEPRQDACFEKISDASHRIVWLIMMDIA
jgi:hypothetical protein